MNEISLNGWERELWILLYQARDTIFKARTSELSEYGITVEQASILFAIHTIGDKATPGEISKWVLREPHTVSSILMRMEKEGLLNRTKDKDLNKRGQLIVTLTEKGRQILSQTSKEESIREIMSCLSKEEEDQLGSLLRRLRDKAFGYNIYNNMKELKPPFP